jgi:hypothetical protein
MYVQKMCVMKINTARNRLNRLSDGTSLGYRSGNRHIVSNILLLSIFVCAVWRPLAAEQVTVSVDSVTASDGSAVPVRVLVENSIPIASVIVPLRYDPDILFPDSVTFDGSAINPDQQYLSKMSSDSSLVRILVLPTLTAPMPVINDPGGLLATIWFSVSPFATEHFTALDTAYVLDSICGVKGCQYFYPEELQASDTKGRQISPVFKSGGVSIDPIP